MRLTYRGISYEGQPLSLEVTEGEVGGVYRGQTWRHQYPQHLPELKPNAPVLQYRGIRYRSHQTLLEGSRIGCTLTTVRPSGGQWLAAVPQALRYQADQRHSENLRRNLLYRLQIAKQKGNEVLVRQLEEESEKLALNV